MLQQKIKNIISSHLQLYDTKFIGLFGSFVRGDLMFWQTIELDLPKLKKLIEKIHY